MNINYPTIIVDNFFKYPHDVRNLAMSMEYTPNEIGLFSGVRTKSLHITHPNFFTEVCDKILNCYSIKYNDYVASMFFHLTGQENGDSGWVHRDANLLLGSVIYLNLDNNSFDSGTTFYKLNNLNHSKEYLNNMRESFKVSSDDKQSKIKHNQNFTPTINIGNMFNRMIAYDASNPHAGTGYYGTNKETSRLTLITFFGHIRTEENQTVLQRANALSIL
tara:strand:+ start:159 stop:815 length:657 start_codon:yes stop_codon:yes gene_type:complete